MVTGPSNCRKTLRQIRQNPYLLSQTPLFRHLSILPIITGVQNLIIEIDFLSKFNLKYRSLQDSLITSHVICPELSTESPGLHFILSST